MQVHDAQLSASAHPAPANGLWRAELGATVKLALPIALTQLGQVTMMTSDLILIGRHSEHARFTPALGSTARTVIRTSERPVVVVPAASRAGG